MEYVSTKRDEQLDIYRALSMMYVLCVTHIIYWLYIGTEPTKSLILVEMPIIFFISGASLSLTTKKSFLQTLINRVKRVLVPYYIYAMVIVVGVALLSIIWHFFNQQLVSALGLETVTNHTYDITTYEWRDVWEIICFVDINQAHFIYHLWFIFPYLILTCTFGLQIKLMNRINRWVYVSLCVLFFFIIQTIRINSLLTTILGYNIFMVAGYLFYRKIKIWQVVGVCLFAIVSLVIYVVWIGNFCPMQDHKFPPDGLFVTYNLAILCFLSLVFGKLTIPNKKIWEIWNTRGYTIYLYQSVVFAFVEPLYKLLISKIDQYPLQWVICGSLVWGLSTLFSYFTYPLELYIMKKTRIAKS